LRDGRHHCGARDPDRRPDEAGGGGGRKRRHGGRY
jgi:hypothetical protein